jgi:glycosyltransferase involved in cell wall biosynthesis
MLDTTMTPWICCQLGAREHYAIPRALHQTNQLAHLATDAWVPPQSLFRRIPHPALRSLRNRYHAELANASVSAHTSDLIRFEITHRLRKTPGWESVIDRNHWFQKRVIQHLATLKFQSPPILFAYSYAALDLLRYAKRQGWTTVLGQIDAAIAAEEIISAEYQKHTALVPNWQSPPAAYWESWREECQLADRIIVNSPWSSQALQQAGIPANKLHIIPLAYHSSNTNLSFQRTYPAHFSTDRLLRILFLGRIVLGKGIAALLEAAQTLQDYPVEFWLVGQSEIDPSKINLPNIRWTGGVPRSEVGQYYQQADVFLFPTLSDGFGLTQLEAQAWKLPLIVSQFCGEVVTDRINGLVLPEVSGNAIVDTLQYCLNHPDQLQTFANQAVNLEQFSLSSLQENLSHLPLGRKADGIGS